MAEKNCRYPIYRPRQAPITDLRDVLNKKREQREHDEQEGKTHKGVNNPPPDPPSLLRDSLRGDDLSTFQQKNDYRSNYGFRGRGNYRRGRGGSRGFKNVERDLPSTSLQKGKSFSCNIKIEFSTETGRRKCTLDNTQLTKNFNPSKKGSDHERGNFRGRNRRKGNYRGQYFYRRENRGFYAKDANVPDIKLKTEEININRNNSTKEADVCAGENWDNDEINYVKGNTAAESNEDVKGKEHDVEEEDYYDEYYTNEALLENVDRTDGHNNSDDEKLEELHIESQSIESEKVLARSTVSKNVDNGESGAENKGKGLPDRDKKIDNKKPEQDLEVASQKSDNGEIEKENDGVVLVDTDKASKVDKESE